MTTAATVIRSEGAGGIQSGAVPHPHPRRLTQLSEREEAILRPMLGTRSFTSNWNVPAWQRVRGHLDVALLDHSLAAVVARHDVLRGGYRRSKLHFVRSIPDGAGVPLEQIDLTGMPPSRREREVQRVVWEDQSLAFDLTAPPLVRAKLLRLSRDDHVLALSFHHLVADRWSVPIVLEELWELYAAARERRPAGLAALGAQFYDYVAWRREDTRGIFQEQRRYWDEQLRGARPLPRFAPPQQQPAQGSAEFASVRMADLSGAQAAALRHACAQHNVSLFILLLTAFKAVLHRYTGVDDIFVDCQTANRMRNELRRMVGCLVNGVRLRTDLSGDPSFAELLRRVRQTTLDGMRRQELEADMYSFRERDALTPDGAKIRFVLRSATDSRRIDGETRVPGLRIQPLQAVPHASLGDVAPGFIEAQDGSIAGSIAFRPAVFDRQVVERMAAHCSLLLRGAIADPERRLSALPMLTPSELRRLTGNGPATPLPAGADVLSEIDTQLQRRGADPAVTTATRSISYDELRRWSHHVAAELRGGVGADEVVAIAVSDPARALAAMIGALRSGVPFVPLGATARKGRSIPGCALHVGAVVTSEPDAEYPSGMRRIALGLDPPGVDVRQSTQGRVRNGADAAYYCATASTGDDRQCMAVSHASLRRLLSDGIGLDLRGADPLALGVESDTEEFVVFALSVLRRGGRVMALGGTRIDGWAGLLRGGGARALVVDAAQARHLLPRHRDALHSLRRLLIAGGSADVASWAADAMGTLPCTVQVLHGPASGARVTLCHLVQSVPASPGGALRGRFIAGRHRIVDARGELLPPGAAGGLALDHGGPVVHRTGWRARVLDANELEILGPAEGDDASARKANGVGPDQRGGVRRVLRRPWSVLAR
jgi:hypothetical protein